ncbi:hypothetical protein NPIL_572441 [Nephila pilipes]|uniref:Uncharacterized protein n=1 Tax=Nephila pilipes TaxID=299642 RepID=A0A8X6P330_NEPPI|nr:hypothetical protein NPIL_572441 [Nephila pilipes]
MVHGDKEKPFAPLKACVQYLTGLCFCSKSPLSESSDVDHSQVQDSDVKYDPSGTDSPQPFSQVEIIDLTRYLGFRKRQLNSWAPDENKKILTKGTLLISTRFKKRIFEVHKNLVYCSDVH